MHYRWRLQWTPTGCYIGIHGDYEMKKIVMIKNFLKLPAVYIIRKTFLRKMVQN